MRAATAPGPAWTYGTALALVVAAAGYAGLRYGVNEEALASLTRHSARIAFLFLFVTFTASVWLTWRATPLTRWLMRRRRHLGLSFATVHFIHLAALSSLFAARGQTPDAATLLGGGLAYVLLALMAATSNNAARRRLGRGWRVLHLTGCWYLWLIFTQSYLGRLAAGTEPYGVFVALSAMALALPVLRIWARVRRRARTRAPALDAAGA